MLNAQVGEYKETLWLADTHQFWSTATAKTIPSCFLDRL
jgi:hypothetical protein